MTDAIRVAALPMIAKHTLIEPHERLNPLHNRTTFAYDGVGNQSLRIDARDNRTSYVYDDVNQLRQRRYPDGTRATFAYDPLGSRTLMANETGRYTTTTYTYSDANQLQTALDSTGITTFAFDADGNQLIEQTPTGDRTTNIWDFENRRTIVELPASVRNTATYDPDGLRVSLADSTGHTNFIWEEQNVLTETDNSNATQAVYTLEPLQYGRLISQRRGSDSHWHLFNALGTTTQLIDGFEAVTDAYILDAWGVPIAVSGSTINPFRFVGRLGYQFDPTLAQYYVRARHYNPRLARWLSKDPLSIVPPNLYRYGGNNPQTTVDPSGALVCDLLTGPCIGAIFTCVCGLVGLLDAFVDLIEGALPVVPPQVSSISRFLDGLDCVCDVLQMIAAVCGCERFGGIDLPALLANMSSCLLNIITLTKQLSQIDLLAITAIYEFPSLLLEEAGAILANLDSTAEACISISSGCH